MRVSLNSLVLLGHRGGRAGERHRRAEIRGATWSCPLPNRGERFWPLCRDVVSADCWFAPSSSHLPFHTPTRPSL